MEITRREAAAILDPVMTVNQVSALIAMTGIPALGFRHAGHAGHPPNLYDRDAITEAHAAEAARTRKQFTDNDWIASALLGRDLIVADPEAGTLHWPDGTRAEEMTPGVYGAVKAGPERVMAHRVIWIAAEGEIPPGIQINHRNRLRWDNRRANLELVTLAENVRHGHNKPYLARAEAAAQLEDLAAELSAPPTPAWLGMTRTGGVFRPHR